jgi:predicted ATPase
MIDRFLVQRYRSLRDIAFEPRALTLITGANGVGKSSLYRSLTLLQRAALGGLGLAVAQEGGIESIAWAGASESASLAAAKAGRAIQGSARPAKNERGIRLGLRTQGCGFELTLGMPEYDPQARSAFIRDPGILEEALWVGEQRNRHSLCMERTGQVASYKDMAGAKRSFGSLPTTESVLSALRDPTALSELHIVRESVRQWRFYDGFRVDADSPLRRARIGVRTPCLASDGADLGACIQTILEIGDADAFQSAVVAGLGVEVEIVVGDGPSYEVVTKVPGVLRSMRAHELSDGTLRYLALMAALFSARPGPLLVLNEPEGSLHPSLITPLAHAIVDASRSTQVWVVTHSTTIASVTRAHDPERVCDVELMKTADGSAQIADQSALERPAWS